ncbi:AP-4 complex subunit epsilon-1-like isoform X2 [Lineus longissimus]|uniref:AP-4 complex subunit epsilon-1-like isoform X2 n=1 Tax=Lineus longissimus TaxID=88925 RepID=UPI00315D5F52
MSDIVEKTISSIAGSLSSPAAKVPQSPQFAVFVDTLGKCRSQHEVDELLKRETSQLKMKLAKPTSPAGIRDCLIRCIYCHLMGHNVSFAYIHAVKLAQQGVLLQKRVGYLASGVFLEGGNELGIMLVNTIQRDIQSTNILEISAGLIAASQLIDTEMIPAILPLVEERLSHLRPSIRKKSVVCLHSFYRKAPGLLEHSLEKFKKALCDKSPEVMWAALHIYRDLIQKNPEKYKDITKSLVYILQQIISRTFPTEFEYNNIPAPWLQIQLLQCMAKLGENDPGTSQLLYPVLTEVLQKIDATVKMGLGVIYECVKTIAAIHPSPALLELAVKCVTKFITAKNINLRYLGLKTLGVIVQINPAYAVPHQDIVIECLDHPDLSVRKKVLDILYKMTNGDNFKVVCQKLMENLQQASDPYIREDIVTKITQLADRYSSDVIWYTQTMNTLILLASSNIPDHVITNIMAVISRTITEKDGEERIKDVESLTKIMWNCIKNQEIPDSLLRVASWVIGEYLDSPTVNSANDVFRILEENFLHDSTSIETKSYILSAIMKVLARSERNSYSCERLLESCERCRPELRQRTKELSRLNMQNTLLKSVCDGRKKINEIDGTLSFLDDFVCDQLQKGAAPYRPRSMRHPVLMKSQGTPSVYTELTFQPYESPQYSGSSTIYSKDQSISSHGSPSSGDIFSDPVLKLKSVPKIWGAEGVARPGAADTSLKMKRSDDGSGSDENQLEGAASDSNGVMTFDVPALSEDEQKKKDLASALFGGLSKQDSEGTNS